ncbi:MAG: dTMP kinase [Candidatus Nanoarchaeia archaeon]
MHNYKGLLITSEGIDFSGKGYVIDTWKLWFKQKNFKVEDRRFGDSSYPDYASISNVWPHDVIVVCEPTKCAIGKHLREEVLLEKEKRGNRTYSARTTAELFAADRLALYQMCIIPALKDGKIVLQDRSVLSSLIYQPLQSKLQCDIDRVDFNMLLSLEGNTLAIDACPPNLLTIAMVPAEVAFARKIDREKQDNCEFEKLEFQQKIAEEYVSPLYRRIFEKKGTIVKYIDTSKSKENTTMQAIVVLEDFLKEKGILK